MKKVQPYKLLSIIFLLLVTNIANASISLGFGESIQTGSTVDVDVTISGLGSGTASSISTYDLEIIFDSSHLSFSGAVFGDSILGNQLDLFNFGENPTDAYVDGATGNLNIYEVSFDETIDLNELQEESFTLATLTFNVLKSDNTQLSFLVNDLGDAESNLLSASLNTGTVSTVPVPAAFWLMISGLGLLYRQKK